MFVAGNAVVAVARVLGLLLQAYMWVVIIYALMSWVNPDPRNPIVRFISALAEPFLDTIRRLLPFARLGALDLSPLIGVLLIYGTQLFVVQSLLDFGARLR